MPDSANHLLGEELPNGWKVVERIQTKGISGGNFSVGYKVRHTDGREGFLKALDFSLAFRAEDISRAMQRMTEDFNFERDILEICRTSKMSRVVVAIDQGQHQLASRPASPPVQYIIFELAKSDVRKQSQISRYPASVYFKVLHHVATGLMQLHSAHIAHQDLKPSNILVFGENESKLADLGRASLASKSCATDSLPVAGDRHYAPPELLYHYVAPERDTRRLGCDFYLLGSMMYFMVNGVMLTPDLMTRLQPAFRPQNWMGTYQQVLPKIQLEYQNCVYSFVANVPEELQEEATRILRMLSDPDPSVRGERKLLAYGRNPFSLERAVSTFDRLAKRSAIIERAIRSSNAA